MSRAQPNLLVVDDDARNRKLLKGILTAAGYEVRLAEDGPTALAMAEELPPDVVLLDVMMSGMNGFQVCQELKSNPRTMHSQVALVTALDSATHSVEGLDHGADDFISKPVRRDPFLAKVRSLLRVRNAILDLEQAQQELAAQNKELAALQSLKDMLAQTLVHDLKNPLTAIMGNLDLLNLKSDESIKPMVIRCQEGAKRMHRMIMNILDIARMEEGALTIEPKEVDPLELLEKAIDDVQLSAQKRSVELFLEGPGEDCKIQGDFNLLRRVMDNLITNAVEHSPNPGQVRVQCRMREEGVELTVLDQGPGVREEDKDVIFEKYSRGAGSAPRSENKGLGLTFCRLAVEAHGGAIWVENAPEGGSIFRAILPAQLEGHSYSAAS